MLFGSFWVRLGRRCATAGLGRPWLVPLLEMLRVRSEQPSVRLRRIRYAQDDQVVHTGITA